MIRILLFLSLPAALAGGPYDAEENLRRALPDAERFEHREIRLDEAASERILRRTGRATASREGAVEEIHLGRSADGRLVGYALVLEEVGKHRPITFLVGVSPAGEVRKVEVLAYREAFGGQIRSRRFLDQFDGRTAADPLQPDRDIHGISGASLSVRSAGVAVRRALALVDEVRRVELARR